MLTVKKAQMQQFCQPNAIALCHLEEMPKQTIFQTLQQKLIKMRGFGSRFSPLAVALDAHSVAAGG
jgi:hypothetical protein